MAILSAASLFFILRILLITLWPASLVDAVPRPQDNAAAAAAAGDGYWLSSIPRNGKVAYGDSSFQIYRNVKDFGAKGTWFLRH
jgi:glucan 1,3-beta-glucosidase